MLNNISRGISRIPLSRGQGATVGVVFLGFIALILTSIAAWVTHVIVCIQTASWVLLVVGAFIAPVGVVHGIGSWFGLF